MVQNTTAALVNAQAGLAGPRETGITVAEMLIADADIKWTEGLHRLVHDDPAATRRAVVRNLAVAPPGTRSAVWAALACGR